MTIKATKVLAVSAGIALLLSVGAYAATTTIKKTTTMMPGSEATTTTTVTETPSGATTTVREEVIATPVPPNAHTFRFLDFDTNGDNILSRVEIGDMLFKLYDRDGDGVLGSTEYNQPTIVTVTPAEKTTTVSYDFDGDGMPDTVQYTYENFMERTMLSRFDKNMNGLSADEFLGVNFIDADENDNRVVDRAEWSDAYFKRLEMSGAS